MEQVKNRTKWKIPKYKHDKDKIQKKKKKIERIQIEQNAKIPKYKRNSLLGVTIENQSG